MTSVDSRGPLAEPAFFAAAQYEHLRSAALGEALAPEARSGLTLFLRRGMWGWARILAAQSLSELSTLAPSCAAHPAPCAPERAALIQVFADMAMNIHDRRSP
jgi:hypothetical protein